MSSMLSSTVMERMPSIDPARVHTDSLDLAGRMVEKHIYLDSNFPTLAELAQIDPQTGPSYSGMSDVDYDSFNTTSLGLSNIKHMSSVNKVSLPPEVMEHFGHMQCHCMMGLFTEINRAWLTIDSDIYVWSYEYGTDVAYFDGLGETIVSVGLVKPKPGIFLPHVKYLMVLTTTTEIAILGVTFSSGKNGPLGPLEEMHLLADSLYSLPTDGVIISTVASSSTGRIFLGGRDGSLLEVAYQARHGWFGKRCKKVNHSTSALSYLLPAFMTFSLTDDDPLIQIVIDNSRHILYTLSDKGTIMLYDLGAQGDSMNRITAISQTVTAKAACNIVRTLDPSLFRPIVSISPIEANESKQLNLVAITQTGVRLYFTASSVPNPTTRPYTLTLLHVRIPPGYSANATQRPPNKVHMAHYSRGSLLLATTTGNEQDALWLLSGDAHPFHPYLCEVQTTHMLGGIAWAVGEVVTQQTTLPCARFQDEILTPFAVRQHYEPPTKYVVLTSQGAEILLKLRPVDILRQILTESHGPESEAVRIYFQLQKPEQACATSLILACLESSQNMQLAEWATRAFFLYGGEPKIGHAAMHQGQQGGSFVASPSYAQSFNPSIVSTPYGGNQQNIAMTSEHHTSIVRYSAKHNGLYLYLSRILRPVWNVRVAEYTQVNRNTALMSSPVTRDDCVWILGHLHALSSFLEKNTQFAVAGSASAVNRTNLDPSLRNPDQEAQLEEKRSLDALKVFVHHTCEVLGLWRILLEHQFHIIVDLLSQDQKNQLTSIAFRNLFLNGQELCSIIINCLINTYLDDNASVDSISCKLREICPTLYRNEDAACSKANEMLLMAKIIKNPEERREKLISALNLCKEVAPQINLPTICQWFSASNFYEGVLDLCVTCAKKLDPKGAAMHYYTNNEPAEDYEGYQAYARRMECYKEVTGVLDQLYGLSRSSPYTPSIPASPGFVSPLDPSLLPPADADNNMRRILDTALESSDELLHVALYSWLLSKQLDTELIGIQKPSLEIFLKRATERQPENIHLFDLLWKHYERKQNHAGAAKILHRLATREGPTVQLSQRIEYLARAVMCLRSEKVGYSHQMGVFLREIEDKIEVARLQQQVLDAISKLRGRQTQVANAVEVLNSRLLEITQLYEDYADPFGLWDCKLAIVHCSGHHDIALIESIWLKIIEFEVEECPAVNANDKMAVLLGKVKSLGREYALSPRCFPLEFLVRQLELQACSLQSDTAQVHTALTDLGVPVGKLMAVYDRLMSAGEPCWAQHGSQFHLIHVMTQLVDTFASNPHMVPPTERRATIAQAVDAVTSCLTTLYSKPDTTELINKLRGLQAKLNRLDK